MADKVKNPFMEDASIMRKFTVLFMVMCILPLFFMCVLYYQFTQTGTILIKPGDFQIALIYITLGMLIGYVSIRNVLKNVIDLTQANRNALEGVLSSDKIKKLSGEKNEIAVLAQAFSSITEKLEENVKTLELAKKTLHSVMTKVGQGISSMQNIDTFLELILETVTDALQGEVGVLMVVDEEGNYLNVKSVYGKEYDPSQPISIPVEKGSELHKAIKAKNAILISQLVSNSDDFKQHKTFFYPPILCSPLVIREKARGIITISGHPESKEFAGDELNLLNNIASQTAVAIENSRLNQDMEKTYFETISALALAVDAKDKYSRGHLERVADYCVIIGRKLGLDDGDIKTLRDAARLHDLGKIGIPDEILGKKAPLNEQEWSLMLKHPEIGESIIKPIRSLGHLCDIIRHHHEKLDGSGYPDGLKGDEVHPLVRILTIADIYDALTTSRPYRAKMSREEACNELRKMSDKLDQDIVEAFDEALKGA